MIKNNKGAALLQVLLVTVILAGIATMLLRASLSRTTAARQTRRTVSSQVYINACMAEVNGLWSMKTREAFVRDMNACAMSCSGTNPTDSSSCTNPVREFTCTNQVVARFTTTAPTSEGCQLSYELPGSKASSL